MYKNLLPLQYALDMFPLNPRMVNCKKTWQSNATPVSQWPTSSVMIWKLYSAEWMKKNVTTLRILKMTWAHYYRLYFCTLDSQKSFQTPDM